MKKMQAVRMGAGDQIMASNEADGDLVDEGMLVNVAKGVESGVKKFNKFDDKVTKAAVKKVKKVGKSWYGSTSWNCRCSWWCNQSRCNEGNQERT